MIFVVVVVIRFLFFFFFFFTLCIHSSFRHNGIAHLIDYTAAAKSLQLCLTLCDPIDGSPPGSSVPGFSRQEHWSGLPLPSAMHESEK